MKPKCLYLLMLHLLLQFMNIDSLSFILRKTSDNGIHDGIFYGSRHQATINKTTLLKWRLHIRQRDWDAKFSFRLEKYDQNEFKPATIYLDFENMRSSEYVKRIEPNFYEIGFYISKLKKSEIGIYRVYARTTTKDIFSPNIYFDKIYEPPRFTECLENIAAYIDHTLLRVQTYCRATGDPQPKVTCGIKGGRFAPKCVQNSRTGEIYLTTPWNNKEIPILQCKATQTAKSEVEIQTDNYFIKHKPHAPLISQVKSASPMFINIRWRVYNELLAGSKMGEILRYRLNIFSIGTHATHDKVYILDGTPPLFYTTTSRVYYERKSYIYYQINVPNSGEEYLVSLQACNQMGCGNPGSARMKSGNGYPPSDPDSLKNQMESHPTKQSKRSTLIISTFTLAGLLVMVLLSAIFCRRQRLRFRQHQLRNPRCSCDGNITVNSPEALTDTSFGIDGIFTLPSYEEAVRSKPEESPPSFDDVLAENEEEDANQRNNWQEPSGVAPPPYPGITNAGASLDEDTSILSIGATTTTINEVEMLTASEIIVGDT